MKKPNITPGTWRADKYDVVLESGDLIARNYRYVESREDLANTKAMSAVPDMIDALIDSYKAIDSLPDDALGKVRPPDRFEEYAVKYELIHNIRKALKKAGVEL